MLVDQSNYGFNTWSQKKFKPATISPPATKPTTALSVGIVTYTNWDALI